MGERGLNIQVTKGLERAGKRSNRGGQRDGEGPIKGFKGTKAVRRGDGKENSQKSQFGDISSFPKRPLRFRIILGKVMPPRKEADGVGEADSHQGLEKGASSALRAPFFLISVPVPCPQKHLRL